MDDGRLFRRPLYTDPLLLLWACGIAIVFAVVADNHIDWGARYNPDRAWELFWIIFWTSLLLWLLALVPAFMRRSVRRGSNWSSKGSRTPEAAPRNSPQPSRDAHPGPRTTTQQGHRPGFGEPTSTDLGETTNLRPRALPAPDLEPLGDLQLLTVAQRKVRQGEPLRLDWHVPQADAVVIDGRRCDMTGAYEVPIERSRDVLFQAFRGDRLIRSVSVPVTVIEEAPQYDWLGAPAATIDRVIRQRPAPRRQADLPAHEGGAVDA